MNNKIDFVIPWVDGNDVEWQKERNRYSTNDGDNRNIRYRDWDNLQYWFRCVEKNAPWVNKIYFITWGHLPNWLNTNNEKLVIINHKDFIPQEYLPTFSSHVIELNLHRIKNISKQFVYFNDDVFILNKVKPMDFFKKGLPLDSAILSPAIKEDKFGIGNVVLNNMAIINTYYDKKKQMKKDFIKWYNLKYDFKNLSKNILLSSWNSFTGFYEFHICSNFLKTTYEKIWELEYKELDAVCKNKFRNLKYDNNQWLFRDWQLASGNFIPRTTKFGKLYTIDDNSNIKKIFLHNKHKVICLNDSDELSEKNYKTKKIEVLEEFNKLFPEKSSYEK